jgi:LmbE family N-acetylglucosaminyl deacetylase
MAGNARLRGDMPLPAAVPRLPEGWPKWTEIVIFSPHSDDAAFSVAGHMFHLSGAGKEFCLLTCFSISAFTQSAAHGDAGSTTELRKREDSSYAGTLGPRCKAAWLDLPDAPLRGYNLREVCQAGEFTAEERILACRLRDHLLSGILPRGSVVFAPLGIGGHIDHRLVHEAAVELAKLECFPVVFYEDMPYAAACQESEISRRILALESRLKGSLACSRYETPRLLDIRRSAASCYPSQVRPETLHKIFNADPPIARYTYERVWRLRRTKESI